MAHARACVYACPTYKILYVCRSLEIDLRAASGRVCGRVWVMVSVSGARRSAARSERKRRGKCVDPDESTISINPFMYAAMPDSCARAH